MIGGGSLKPYVIVFVTESLDGKIASKTRDSRLSCPYDLRRLHTLRAQSDAVMVGAGTVLSDNPRLTVRYVKGRNPIRVIIDGKLRIPLNARVLDVTEALTVIFTSPNAPKDKVQSLMSKGVHVEVINEAMKGTSIIDLGKVLEVLNTKYSVNKLLVEGGSELLWHLFSSDLVDEVRVTISPFIIGGKEAITMVGGLGFSSRDEWVRLKLINYELCECGNEIHLVYKVIKSPDKVRMRFLNSF